MSPDGASEGWTCWAVIPGDLRSRSGWGSSGKVAHFSIPFPALRAAGDDGEHVTAVSLGQRLPQRKKGGLAAALHYSVARRTERRWT
ncbi:hypothetical protein GCM10007036_08810 [Alsobacter metallidurans]|uniref:Uncharacterized protein n=1 Tax=Alsobacter metallidurans TaxID=340221 RepID=A0A917I5G5_9HYPH|nr:hypothetical protein GCM10007036_08810 [Alsobacter metallidurans]